jgi:O-acetyl-ADP-ribose deacetylase (regulator of RNase III)
MIKGPTVVEVPIGDVKLEASFADITMSQAPVIVTAANRKLAGGGGVDKAIWDAAGNNHLADYIDRVYPNGCPTGRAVRTPGFDLCHTIIHAVGPRFTANKVLMPVLLRAAYTNSMQQVKELKAVFVAFPLISSGAFKYPLEAAVRIGLQAVTEFILLNDLPALKKVGFYTLDERAFYELRGQLS